MTLGGSHRTLREVVVDELRAMITRGELRPGDRLIEDHLAEQLGVSRNPVREAIRALESTGLVEVRPRKGAYVSSFDLDDVRKLLQLRAVLEAYAAELAAAAHDPAGIGRLAEVLARGRHASAANDLVRAAECHREFHVAIEDMAGNPYLVNAVSPLRHQTELVFSVLSPHRSELSWDEHERILDAIAAGDPERARTAARTHMDEVVSALEEQLGRRAGE
ncbi:MAG TPA: GntR family transcriptional regulator [Acidimicrobiales bacterium]